MVTYIDEAIKIMEPYGIFFLATSSISTRYLYYFAAHEKQIRTHMHHYLGGLMRLIT